MSTTTETDQVDGGFSGVTVLEAEQRYGEERSKRLRDDGSNQYIDITTSGQHHSFVKDPWVDESTVPDVNTMFEEDRCRALILGAGLGGLQVAINLLDIAGLSPADLRIVENAGGFGGTWYWNRYPGLACDVESYIYFPRLEETGYIPSHKYAGSEEIRKYANLLAEKWKLQNSAVFQTKMTSMKWDETVKEWIVQLSQEKSTGAQHLTVRAQFVADATGLFSLPKLPNLSGLEDYQGEMFHSSRWDYNATGGSPSDPSLSKLSNKRVAVIGTGASALQIVPQVARWAKQLYVVQRTPASVDKLVQHKTDEEWFRSNVATGPGWQQKRMSNAHQQFTTGQRPDVDLVNDSWTSATGIVALCGNPDGPKTMEALPAYLQQLREIDIVRTNRIRAQVQDTIQDKQDAEAMKPWYPTWCKRRCFSDTYLETFNRGNVALVDTAGRGVERIEANAVVAGGETYEVDMIIFASGFRAPLIGSPADKANGKIIGRGGVSMSEVWAQDGPSTLHGVLDANFPNLILSGPWQASIGPVNHYHVDVLSKYAARIIASAERRSERKSFAVVPNKAATEAWKMQILQSSPPTAALGGCTPSYFNAEGAVDRLSQEQQMKLGAGGLWGFGIEAYLKQLEQWRVDGGEERDIDVVV